MLQVIKIIQFLLDFDAKNWISFCSWDLSVWRYRFDCSKCDSRGKMEKEKTVNIPLVVHIIQSFFDISHSTILKIWTSCTCKSLE